MTYFWLLVSGVSRHLNAHILILVQVPLIKGACSVVGQVSKCAFSIPFSELTEAMQAGLRPDWCLGNLLGCLRLSPCGVRLRLH